MNGGPEVVNEVFNFVTRKHFGELDEVKLDKFTEQAGIYVCWSVL